jgi:hypothetical protein
MSIDLIFLLEFLSFVAVVICPLFIVLLRDLQVFVDLWIKVTDDGKITEDEFNDLIEQAGTVLKLFVHILYIRRR